MWVGGNGSVWVTSMGGTGKTGYSELNGCSGSIHSLRDLKGGRDG